MGSEELFSREEVLGGMPAQRARTLLFLIESRTAQLVERSRRAMEWYLTEERAEERDMAFFAAFSAGKDPPLRPTIQDLERFSPQWANLIPGNPVLRAALAHMLGEKYSFASASVPGIRHVLDLDGEAVRRAYQRQYKGGLEDVYADRPGLGERIRWVWTRIAHWLENLPPFWTAFALTLTETVGAGILALPIALASIGPLAGVVLVVVIGLINMLTIAFMAEAVSRSGEIRYGSAYLGRLVEEFLGKAGSVILSIALVLIISMALLAYFVGFSTTLEDATRAPAIVWAFLLFLVNLYFLRKKTINATVSASLLVGAVNIGVILALAAMTIPWIQAEYLTYINVPLVGGQPFDPTLLQLVFGVVLAAYFGHTSMANCAKLVLKRDPSSRSLIWGTVAAQVAAIALYSIWLVTINGAVAPTELASLSGTALEPLADRVGPLVHVLGSIFVILGMGMASVHYSLGFFNLTQEWLPKRRSQTSSSLSVEGDLRVAGMGASDLISLPREQRKVMDWVMRRGKASLGEVATYAGKREEEVRPEVEALVTQGFLGVEETPDGKIYKSRLLSKTARKLPEEIWQALEETGSRTNAVNRSSASIRGVLPRITELSLSETGRFTIGVLPLGLIFVLTEWLLATESESFSRPLSFIGVIVVSLLGGIFPALLLVASRKKGERASEGSLQFLGHPVLIIGVYLISLAGLFLHGLVIWQNPFERGVALATGITMVIVTIAMIRQEVFAPRMVLELREEQAEAGRATYAITMAGQDLPGEVQLEYAEGWQEFYDSSGELPDFSKLRSAVFRVPIGEANDLKVWAHRVSLEGDTEGLPALLEVRRGLEIEQFDLQRSRGRALIPFRGEQNGHIYAVRLIFARKASG